MNEKNNRKLHYTELWKVDEHMMNIWQTWHVWNDDIHVEGSFYSIDYWFHLRGMVWKGTCWILDEMMILISVDEKLWVMFWSWFLHPSWLLGALGTCILRAREVNPSSWLQHPSSLFSQDTKSTGFQKFASTHSKGSTTRFVASSWWNVDGEVLTKKTLKQGWNNSKTLNISAHLGPKISGNQPSSLQPGRGRTFTDSASDVSDTWRIDLGLVNNVGQQPNDWIDSPRRYGWWPKSG